jgi:altronate hydrolase
MSIQKNQALQIHPGDNVAVALTTLAKDTYLELHGTQYHIVEEIPQKHKFALETIDKGSAVIMYGNVIGKATMPIAKGGLLHLFNVRHASSKPELRKGTLAWEAPDISGWSQRTFMGYHRKGGKVGTRNSWLVIPLVFCENRNIRVMQEALEKVLGYGSSAEYEIFAQQWLDSRLAGGTVSAASISPPTKKPFPKVDGVRFLTHDGGCGGTRADAQALCALLAGYIAHPNTAGATVLSLGCQNAQIEMLEAALQQIEPAYDRPLHILEQQQSQSEKAFIEQAISLTLEGIAKANEVERKPAPLSKLIIGLECGGSDGFSGISANPLLGKVSDLIATLGGSPVLSEFPELEGVEQNLIDRSVSLEVATRFLSLMDRYRAKAAEVSVAFDMNPSPGNIKDGLITDAMKSSGAALKGGSSPVCGVLDYTEQVQRPGLHLLCTPGNDVESTTALAGSGCNLILFTTGLGTPTGNPLAPVIKVSSNTALYQKMSDLIDFDAGSIITGTENPESLAQNLLEYLIEVASGGATTAAERLGQQDFIPWKRGISL